MTVIPTLDPARARASLCGDQRFWHWPRSVSDQVTTIADAIVEGPWFELRFDADVEEMTDVVRSHLSEAGVAASPSRDALTIDIAALGGLLASVAGCTELTVRLEVTGRLMCPLFQQDNNVMRLLCTYAGPGTEWLPDDLVDRSQLGLRGRLPEEANAAIALGDPFRCRPGEVLILTGSRFQLGGVGVIHRSPRPELGPSLLVAIDPVQPGSSVHPDRRGVRRATPRRPAPMRDEVGEP